MAKIGLSSIFILKPGQNSPSFKASENYLVKKGWSVSSAVNLRDALRFVLSNRPEIVMIAADHPNKKARKIPQIFSQAGLPMQIIGYSESKISSAISALHEMGCKYILYPPISGPAIERIILKIRQDESDKQIPEMNVTTAQKEAVQRPLAAAPEVSAQTGSQRTTLTQEEIDASFEKARAALSKLIAPEGEREIPENSDQSDWQAAEDANDRAQFMDEAEKALSESLKTSTTEPANIQPKEPVNKISQATCIEIISPRFKGYLVAAFGNNRKLDHSFMDELRNRFFSFMKMYGEGFKEKPSSMEVELKEVQFQDWAIEQAEFLKTSIHDGNEVAVAFFPSENESLQLEESVNDQMLKITLAELKDDSQVGFDLYIYMPQNDKFLLYTPQGKTFYGRQKDRLLQKGITHMHLRKESATAAKKYRVQNFLNEKIEEYKNKLKK